MQVYSENTSDCKIMISKENNKNKQVVRKCRRKKSAKILCFISIVRWTIKNHWVKFIAWVKEGPKNIEECTLAVDWKAG